MSARWVFTILLCCRLSQGDHACYDNYGKLTTVCVSAGENVSVPCPKIKTQTDLVTYSLYQSNQLVYNHSCSPGACTALYTSSVGLHESKDNKSVSFVLSGVNASDYNTYRCEKKVAYPPPYKTESSDFILVLVKGHQCSVTPATPVPPVEQYCGLYWIVTLAVVSLYGVIATVIAIINWVKLRRTDSQSDYMNTKPKPARDRRKKRGVQNLFPRHF